MTLLKTIKKAAVTCCLLGFTSMATAGVISFDPTPALVTVGNTISVDLIWDGSAGPDYISAYDVDIGWDALIVSLDSVTLDPDLGVDAGGCFPGFTCDALIGAGTVDIFEVSFDAVLDLIANQDSLGNSFTLATLTFIALEQGATDLILTAQAIGDEFGMGAATTLINGQICVGEEGTVASCPQVPAPGTIPLLILGVLAFGGIRARHA